MTLFLRLIDASPLLAIVATSCYNERVGKTLAKTEFETVGTRDFGNSVSAYLRKAALGVRVLISDRGKIVAELRAFDPDSTQAAFTSPRLQQWTADGLLRPALEPRRPFPRGKSLLKGIKVKDLIDDLRED